MQRETVQLTPAPVSVPEGVTSLVDPKLIAQKIKLINQQSPEPNDSYVHMLNTVGGGLGSAAAIDIIGHGQIVEGSADCDVNQMEFDKRLLHVGALGASTSTIG